MPDGRREEKSERGWNKLTQWDITCGFQILISDHNLAAQGVIDIPDQIIIILKMYGEAEIRVRMGPWV